MRLKPETNFFSWKIIIIIVPVTIPIRKQTFFVYKSLLSCYYSFLNSHFLCASFVPRSILKEQTVPTSIANVILFKFYRSFLLEKSFSFHYVLFFVLLYTEFMFYMYMTRTKVTIQVLFILFLIIISFYIRTKHTQWLCVHRKGFAHIHLFYYCYYCIKNVFFFLFSFAVANGSKYCHCVWIKCSYTKVFLLYKSFFFRFHHIIFIISYFIVLIIIAIMIIVHK